MKALMGILAFVLVAMLSSLAAACSGGTDELTLREYFAQLQTQNDEAEQRSAPAEAEFEQGFASASSLAEQIQVSKAFFRLALLEIEDSVKDFNELDPPSEAAEAHDELRDGLEDAARFAEDLIDQFDSAESEADLLALFGDYVSAFEPLEAPCLRLERIADDNGIEFDIDCESSESDQNALSAAA